MSRDERASVDCLADLRRTPARSLRWLVASTTGFFAFAYVFGAVLAAGQGRSLEPIILGTPSGGGQFLALLAVVLALLAVVTVHEWIHGVFLARYGGRPRYGIGVSSFGLPYAYAAAEHSTGDPDETAGDLDLDETPDTVEWGYARNELLVVLLAPFVLVSALGLLALVLVPSPLLVFLLAANAAGSVADLWLAGVLLGYPRDVRVGPSPSPEGGFAIYSACGRSTRRAVVARAASSVVSGTVATYAALVLGLGAVVLHSLAFDTGTVAVEIGSRTLLRHEFFPDRGVALFGVDTPLFAGLSVGGGLVWLAVTAPARFRAISGA